MIQWNYISFISTYYKTEKTETKGVKHNIVNNQFGRFY